MKKIVDLRALVQSGTDQGADSEFLMMAPQADRIVPMFAPLFTDEPVPADGQTTVDDAPGFGVNLNPGLQWNRPFPA